MVQRKRRSDEAGRIDWICRSFHRPKLGYRTLPRVTEPPDKLLDLIYDAATEPDLWRAVMTAIADHTGSQGGILYGQSLQASRIHFEYNGRLSDECNRAFQERHTANPWSTGMQGRPAGRIVLSEEILPLSSLRPTLFFEEVLRPQDVAHNAMAALVVKGDFRAAFNLCRSARQGPLDGDERQWLERVMPHLCRSMELGFRIEGYHALQGAAHHVLDRLSIGVILLNRSARIVYANAAARELDSDAGPLRLSGGMVTARSPSHSRRLGDLIRAALIGAPAGSMNVPLSGDGAPVIILVSSVRGRDVGRLADLHMRDAAVLLFVINPANRAGIPMSWMMDGYGLTRAEARVALAASSGLTVPETAGVLGISPNTVKTHLRRVFAKTAMSQQAELSRLVASLSLVWTGGPAKT